MTVYDPRLLALLAALETEMRALGYWAEHPPSAKALRSPLPFCYDTLNFLQWVQWVFVPRMRQTVDEQRSLAARCQIKPAAEVYFDQSGLDSGTLLDLFEQLDQLASVANRH